MYYSKCILQVNCGQGTLMESELYKIVNSEKNAKKKNWFIVY